MIPDCKLVFFTSQFQLANFKEKVEFTQSFLMDHSCISYGWGVVECLWMGPVLKA